MLFHHISVFNRATVILCEHFKKSRVHVCNDNWESRCVDKEYGVYRYYGVKHCYLFILILNF